MSEEALVDHIFVRLEPQVQYYVEIRNPQNTVQLYWRCYLSLRKDIRAKQCGVREIVMLKDEVRMRVGCLILISRKNWRNSEVLCRPSNGRNDYRDFDRKSLAIPDLQIDTVFKTIEEGNVEIDLSKTGLEEKQKQELRDLFNSFKGLFSDTPGLTHALYHEIDTGDKPPVVSRPYRYDRVKQAILDYHVEKMLK
ncbi:uncharacterized protein TNCV_4519521 [Trichonephila clavipes]|nr:uncharacterized protein TNCV_4519521 [Trichonephila clavipes]